MPKLNCPASAAAAPLTASKPTATLLAEKRRAVARRRGLPICGGMRSGPDLLVQIGTHPKLKRAAIAWALSFRRGSLARFRGHMSHGGTRAVSRASLAGKEWKESDVYNV